MSPIYRRPALVAFQRESKVYRPSFAHSVRTDTSSGKLPVSRRTRNLGQGRDGQNPPTPENSANDSWALSSIPQPSRARTARPTLRSGRIDALQGDAGVECLRPSQESTESCLGCVRKPINLRSLSEIDFGERKINNLRKCSGSQVIDSSFKKSFLRQAHTVLSRVPQLRTTVNGMTRFALGVLWWGFRKHGAAESRARVRYAPLFR